MRASSASGLSAWLETSGSRRVASTGISGIGAISSSSSSSTGLTSLRKSLALNVELGTLDPVARLSRVAQLVTEHDLARYDLAVIAWAEHDERAAECVERVHNMRLKFSRRALSELGITGDELTLYSRLFVSYVSWDSRLLPKISKRKRTRLYRLLISLITERASRPGATS